MKDWTEDRVVIAINFTDPLLISRGQNRDNIEIILKNPNLFLSKDYGLPIESDGLKIIKSIPR